MTSALVVVGNGHGAYRDHMLRALAARHRLLLVTTDPVTWERPHLTDYVRISGSDLDELVTATERLARLHKAAGVLTYHEPFVAAAAIAADKLGLARCSPQALSRCRDKYSGRAALHAVGVPAARCVLVRTESAAVAASADIGYPVVVKPRALSAGFGVSLVRDEATLAEAFRCARDSTLAYVTEHREEVLVEEYLDGPEISVDSVVTGGVVIPMVYAHKQLGFAPYFEELGHIVAPEVEILPDAKARQEIRAVLTAAHQALGLDNVVTHSELRLTTTGPRVVEVNGRPGGDLIPHLGVLATGVEVATAAADVALGRFPSPRHTRTRAAGIRFFYPDIDGTVRRLGIDPSFGHPEWLRQLTWVVGPGAALTLPPVTFHDCRVGFAIVVANSVEECAGRLAVVEDAVVVEMERP